MDMYQPVSTDPDHRLVTDEAIQSIIRRIQACNHKKYQLRVNVQAWWQGELRWARNRVNLASDRRDIRITVHISDAGNNGWAFTNQVDDVSLEGMFHEAERQVEQGFAGDVFRRPYTYDGVRWEPPLLSFPDTPIWSEATYQVTPEQRGELGRMLSDGAEAEQMLSAGYLQMRVGEFRKWWPDTFEWVRTDEGFDDSTVGSGATRKAKTVGYVKYTEAQCSMTVRHPKGVGSGWAGLSGYDWSVINAPGLAERALQKCRASLNPVAVEPGRYTVILEPQAVGSLIGWMVVMLQRRQSAEDNTGPFSLGRDAALGIGRSKLGLKVVDERVTIDHDPMDPLLGIFPEPGLEPVTWIERGVLKTLGYPRGQYAVPGLTEDPPVTRRNSFRMHGGATSMDEMISTTKRGLLVTRVSGDRYVRGTLVTGVTRDGLWLIENGTITKAVKNMRFTDSPFFVLNQLEQLGPAVPIFKPMGELPLRPVVVPPLKSRDFAFTATIDAI